MPAARHNRLVGIREAALVVAGGCALLTAACASVTAGHPLAVSRPAASSSSAASSSPTPTPTPTLTPSGGLSAPADPWVHITDEATGISFLLPEQAHPTERPRPGTALVQRLYQVQLAGEDFGVSVGLLTSTQGRFTFTKRMVDSYPGAIREQFKSVGVADAEISEKQHVTVQGHYGLRFRFAFTPLDPGSGRGLWFIEVVAADNALLILQTIGLPAPATAAADEAVVRAVNAKLDAGLRL